MSEKEVQDLIVEEELNELEKEEVEQFDDYLEMIMTFGYITLFASAFPFGTTLTSIFIYLETKSDMFKFEKTARRPLSRKAHSIGSWEIALDMLSFGAVFTNIVLCCYASNQIDNVLPWLKGLREDSATNIYTIFGIEHVMLGFVLVTRLVLSSKPSWLRTFEERLANKNAKRHEKRSLQKRKTLVAMNTFIEDPVQTNEASPYAEDSALAGESLASLAEEDGVSNMAFAATSAITETQPTTASTNQRPKQD